MNQNTAHRRSIPIKFFFMIFHLLLDKLILTVTACFHVLLIRHSRSHWFLRFDIMWGQASMEFTEPHENKKEGRKNEMKNYKNERELKQ